MSSDTEREREIAWDKSAKGRGNRWRMIREVVALLSVSWMNLQMVQDAMFQLKGLKRSTVVDIMTSLERAGHIKPVSGEISGVTVSGWGTTERGVKSWIGKRTNIPASIAQVALITSDAVKYALGQQVSKTG